jgi:hypothetical protein
MKTRLLLIVALLTMFAGNTATAAGDIPKCQSPNSNVWSDCSVDSDCAVMLDACNLLTTVHTQYVSEAQAYYNCIAPLIDCPEIDPSQDINTAKAGCVDRKCVLLEPK